MTPAYAYAFLRSTLGLKIVMALTGLVLFGFVVGHMVGNLQVYLGRAAFNAYAESLRELGHGGLLWVARTGLIVAAGLHIWSAWRLTLVNRAARPVGYRQVERRESTFASRTMRWTGVILLLFLVYHLLHFTFGPRAVHPHFVPGDAYHNFVTGFQNPLVSAFYVLAMVFLGLHLYHGAWSFMQTLGLSHPRYDRLRHAFATVLTVVVVVGNISFPIAVLGGLVREQIDDPARAATHSLRGR
ncbi:MAG TPA: succinate dehydrogenase cytochrome b subunit [Vicinamibacteria bacterium]|nr:succinate dehydrogenase cytochrome b subunit [Vicinamibacteria bacterium]